MNIQAQSAPAMPEAWTRIVEAIATAPLAWSTPEEVVAAVGMEEDETFDQLAAMDVGGLIDVWDRPEGLTLTLSALAAERWGFRLIETDAPTTLRWARSADPDPPARKAYQVVRSASMASFSFVIDPRPGPEAEAEQNEQAARYQANGHFGTFRKGAGRGEPPRPTLLIGSGHNGWAGQDPAASGDCPACRSRRLPAHAYCLCCDRWGLDAPPRPGGRPTPLPRNFNPDLASRRPPRDSRIDRAEVGKDSPNPHRPAKDRLRVEQGRRHRLLDRLRGRKDRPTG